ncbi:TetR/AcrR family transcriptional regulator [Conexibacter sp. SYSU D00693]|uniref:TetR/AcrR family transcriptional regulator n=1 Tax=Conexibacter sp. SYSU D00693 TaxID=2812560 RepID=UPI00196A7D3A|nr:TetR/AcrR family transcriptional regulator [Conexibacter sp. SYSU D00693]
MARSKEEKAASHRRIVEVTAARIREQGTAQPGVAEVMREAGLTHGGFYKHFGSREDLIAEAAAEALTQNNHRIPEVVAGADDRLKAFVDWYVSVEHRDDPGGGCGVVALGADAARSDERVRDAYAAQVERYLGLLEDLLGDDRDRAPVVLSTLVGAVLIARALGDSPRSEDLLRAVRAAVAG